MGEGAKIAVSPLCSAGMAGQAPVDTDYRDPLLFQLQDNRPASAVTINGHGQIGILVVLAGYPAGKLLFIEIQELFAEETLDEPLVIPAGHFDKMTDR